MKIEPTHIHEKVREQYAELARSSSCCQTSDDCCSSSNRLYPDELILGLSKDISSFSLGCGDPITLAGLNPGETVLDLGSGGGLDCFLAAKEVGPDGHVIGVDMTPEMIARARASAQRMDVTNVEFRQGYLEDLPVAENSVDVVISNCVINLSPDKEKVFAEINRVLKPGGRVAIADIVTNGPLPDYLKEDMEAWSACISGALDIKDYTVKLISAGFDEVSIRTNGDASDILPSGRPFSATISAVKTRQ